MSCYIPIRVQEWKSIRNQAKKNFCQNDLGDVTDAWKKIHMFIEFKEAFYTFPFIASTANWASSFLLNQT